MSKKYTIAVTGASGYIASWIIKKLLEQGHTVKGTVRSLSNKKKIAHLENMTSSGALTLYEADLLKAGSFDKAFEGCDVVMHTASPFMLNSQNPMQELVDPALKGTENVLGAVSKISTVKKVILTSSIAAIYHCSKDSVSHGQYTEKDWNTKSNIKNNPYYYSKTLAEKSAWKLAESQNQWKLVVINPGGVYGPAISPAIDSESVNFVRRTMRGEFANGTLALNIACVDVRDVADAHILALSDNANGRYILCENTYSMLELSNLIEAQYPNKYKLPKRVMPKAMIWLLAPLIGLSRTMISNNIGYKSEFDNSKSKKELKLNYTPMSITMKDHVAQLAKDENL